MSEATHGLSFVTTRTKTVGFATSLTDVESLTVVYRCLQFDRWLVLSTTGVTQNHSLNICLELLVRPDLELKLLYSPPAAAATTPPPLF